MSNFLCNFWSWLTGSSAKTNPSKLGLGWQEKPMGGSYREEDAMIEQFVKDIEEVQKLNQAAAHADAPQRTFHAKSIAAMDNAEFRVSQTIPKCLQVGFLQPGSTYSTTVRFSNASGIVQPDGKPDLRGAVLRLHFEGGGVQDFLMTSAPANHVRDAKQFIQFALAAASGKLIPNLFKSVGLWETIRIMATVVSQTIWHVKSLTKIGYWSRAPYAFGTRAVKFEIVPNKSQSVSVPDGPDYLRQDFSERLKKGPVVFDFRVQLFVNEKVTPIEDGSVEWLECNSPFIKIAELYIPQQDLTTAEARDMEVAIGKLAFNPWNRVAEITPIGSLNRARKDVYRASADGRHGIQPTKPAS